MQTSGSSNAARTPGSSCEVWVTGRLVLANRVTMVPSRYRPSESNAARQLERSIYGTADCRRGVARFIDALPPIAH